MSLHLPIQTVTELLRSRNLDSWLPSAAEALIQLFSPRRLLLVVRDRNGRYSPSPLEWVAEGGNPLTAAQIRPLLEKIVEEHSGRGTQTLRTFPFLAELGHETVTATSALLQGELQFWAVCFDAPLLSVEDLQAVMLLLSDLRACTTENELPLLSPNYEQLVEQSDAIVFHADPEHRVQFINRRALDFFGMGPDEFVGKTGLKWYDLIHPDDVVKVRNQLQRQRLSSHPFDEEIRVINRVTGRLRWVLIRLIPLVTKGGQLTGWDGFGFDISARKEAQAELDAQSKKIRALYTVSSAIRGFLDPANIAIRGLAALCDATGASSGVSYLFPVEPPPPKGTEEWEELAREEPRLQCIARYGFPSDFDNDALAGVDALSAMVARSGQSLVVPNLCSDNRSADGLLTQDLLRAAVLVPIAVEDRVLGVVGLFSNQTSRFDGSTVMLVSAAANQIGLAARQANLLELYQRQTKYLAALYRMSHELSRHLEPEALYKNAFSIIRDELGLRRIWLGLLNDAGNLLIGKAADGPGWRRALVNIEVDVTKPDYALGRVVATRRPRLITNIEALYREFGVEKIFSRMSINAVALLPVMAGQELLGVLAVQPGVKEESFTATQLRLISSMAAEIGTHLQNQRLLSRMQDAEKMRSSALLAAGVAHNFNNSLQAILGQASLLEMQSRDPERIRRSAGLIIESATRSAALVRQLLAFTQFEEPDRQAVDLGDFLERGQEGFRKLLGPGIRLELVISRQAPYALCDIGQISRVINSLLQNAREALGESGVVRVELAGADEERRDSSRSVRLSISDNGPGMSEDKVKRCFEPFFTTKNVDPDSGLGLTGSGLGLSTSYTLVRKNGGRIVAESKLGAGSTFTVYLPVAESSLKVEKISTREDEAKGKGELPLKEERAAK